MIKFGPSGTGLTFGEDGLSKTIQVPSWLKAKNLDLFEYSFGRGVRIGEETARTYGEEFAKHGIEISVHAPYFINMATDDEQKALNNHNYLIDSIAALKNLGGNRCVFHPGSPLKKNRRDAMDILIGRMDIMLQEMYDLGHNDILLGVETMGKFAQLGDEDEVIEIVSRDNMLVPCIDFGHLNARTCGGITGYDEYARIIEKFINGVGFEKVDNMHIHFSKIEYSPKGEVRHLTFGDTQYGPDYEPLAKAFHEFDIHPYVVCESAGTQTEDSLYMKNYYNSLK